MTDQIVGLSIATSNGRIVIVMRRDFAHRVVGELLGVTGDRLVLLDDIVGNPVIVRSSAIQSVMIVEVALSRADLIKGLAPIPPGFDVDAAFSDVPETVPESAGPKPALGAEEVNAMLARFARAEGDGE